MCTVVVSFAPSDKVPLLLLGIRDEFTDRSWQPPARHWPGSPLIAGRDEQADGTWLAVHPDLPRVSCILNGRGDAASPSRRRSRGELPLRAAQQGPEALRTLHADLDALASYDPFYLVCADREAVLLLGWDGTQPTLSDLPPATHLLTNAGHTYPPATAASPAAVAFAPGGPAPGAPPPGGPAPGAPPPGGPPPGGPAPDPKAVRFGPKFAALRPSGDPGATIEHAWAGWLTLAGGGQLAAGEDMAHDEPGAIIVRRELPDGRVWGSTSVSLVALSSDDRLRYDFQPLPADPTTWYPVSTETP